MAGQPQELVVRGNPSSEYIRAFLDEKYIVNRRYQRKWIWTLEEKQSFIDSIISGYPVPIILLAERVGRSDGTLEIIDGMQRLNAITSFVNNEFPVDEEYFDLNTVAVTKELLDSRKREQKNSYIVTHRMCRDSIISSSTFHIRVR